MFDYEYRYLENLRNSELLSPVDVSGQINPLTRSTINTAAFKDDTWLLTSNVSSAGWMFCLKARYAYTDPPSWSPGGASIIFPRVGENNEIQYDFSNLARQQLSVSRGLADATAGRRGDWARWKAAIEANRNPKGKKPKANAEQGVATMITDLRDTAGPEEKKLLGYLLESNYPRKCWLTGYPCLLYTSDAADE